MKNMERLSIMIPTARALYAATQIRIEAVDAWAEASRNDAIRRDLGTQVSFPVNFFSNGGTPLNVPALGGSSTQVYLAEGGTAIIEAPNTGSLAQGYVAFNLPSGAPSNRPAGNVRETPLVLAVQNGDADAR